MRRPRPYNPDPDTLRLLDEFRDVSAESRALAQQQAEFRQRRAEIVRQLIGRGLTYRRIAAEVGVSKSFIQALGATEGAIGGC